MLDEPQIVDVGLMPYDACLELQRRLHAEVVAGGPERIIVVEHPPVLTLGHNADPRFLSFAEAHYRAQGIAIHRIERGGEVTAHEPGQLVVYPLLRLERHRLSPKRYVMALEAAVIAALAELALAAAVDCDHPGVWIGLNKVCAIGVRIKERVSLHGLALNCDNSLELFNMIVPCGIAGRGVTTVSKALGRPVTTGDLAPRVLAHLLPVICSARVAPTGECKLESQHGTPSSAGASP